MTEKHISRYATVGWLALCLGLSLAACGFDSDSGPPSIDELEASGAEVESGEGSSVEQPPAPSAPNLPPVGQYRLVPIEVEGNCAADSPLAAGLPEQSVAVQLLDQGETLTLMLSIQDEAFRLERILSTESSSEFEGPGGGGDGLTSSLAVLYSSADSDEVLEGTLVVDDPAANCSVLTDFSLTRTGS